MKIVNMTATANLGEKIDITKLHKPKKFSGAVIKGNNSTALVFKSGRIVIIGTTTEHEAYEAALDYHEKLKIKSKLRDFKVHNFVGSASLGFQLDLNRMSETPRTLYTPEIFPGLTWTPSYYNNNATVLLFTTGKIVITGCKTLDDVNVSYQNVLTHVEKFRK